MLLQQQQPLPVSVTVYIHNFIKHDPGILPGTHLGSVLGSKPKGNCIECMTCTPLKLAVRTLHRQKRSRNAVEKADMQARVKLLYICNLLHTTDSESK